MGAQSTILITRDDAIQAIITKLSDCSNKEIEDIAEKLEIAGCLYNYSIVTEYRKGEWSNFLEMDDGELVADARATRRATFIPNFANIRIDTIIY